MQQTGGTPAPSLINPGFRSPGAREPPELLADLGILHMRHPGFLLAYLLAVACCGVVRLVPEIPGVPGDATELRAANARLRELPAEWPGLRVRYEEGACGTELLPALTRTGALQRPIFAFLDSYGGPDVPFTLPQAIARQPSSEVLITFGTNFLTRFGSKEQHQQTGDEAFGGTAWRQVQRLPAHEKKAFLVSAYRQSLIAAGFGNVVSFEMTDETGADLHLVFGTRRRAGVEKMKDAMWKVDPVRGVHYRDPRDPNQMTFDFDLHPHLDPLRNALLRELGSGERTLANLQEYALLETVYRGPHAIAAVRTMVDQGLAEREPHLGQITRAARIRLTAAGRRRLTESDLTLF